VIVGESELIFRKTTRGDEVSNGCPFGESFDGDDNFGSEAFPLACDRVIGDSGEFSEGDDD
jgi:hypothetical protein